MGINEYDPRGQFISFHNRQQRWAVLVCHRRAGKTVACVADLVLSALVTSKQDARFAYVCPQYNQAKDVAWTYIKRLTSDIPNVQYNESELRADLPNGARIRLYGADNPDRLRGVYLDGVVLDEFADMRSSVWGEVVRPMLADRKGWAVFIGTPKGHNAFYDCWQDAQMDIDWFRLMLKASESGLIDASELKDAAKGMTDDQYAQEFECSFEAAIAGAYYANDLKEEHVREVAYDPRQSVYTAWDIGYSDDTAIWFWQMSGNEVHVIDFYSANGHGVEHYVNMLNEKGYNYAKIGNKPFLWLPHDARAKTFASGGKSTQEQFMSYGYSSRIVPELSLQDGINAMRMMLPKTYFDRQKCFDGVECLKLYRREYDDDKKVFRDKPLHDWTSHAADAARYMAIAYRVALPEAQRPEPKYAFRGTENGMKTLTLDEMWALTPKRSTRI
ncbi:MAG: terminase family protein [Patescibacteria group bacterium]|nr:terminase family protein [Patescibacteria group bacterium]